MLNSVMVKQSGIQGRGVFACRNVDKGEVILEFDDSRIVDDTFPLQEGESFSSCDWVGFNTVLLKAPEKYLNHCCEPSAFIRYSKRSKRKKDNVEGKPIYRRLLVALKNIKSDSEVTIDYSIDSWGYESKRCKCGDIKCREEIPADFFQLPQHKIDEYRPLLSPWFRAWKSEELDKLAVERNTRC